MSLTHSAVVGLKWAGSVTADVSVSFWFAGEALMGGRSLRLIPILGLPRTGLRIHKTLCGPWALRR